jgi:hypothetical protein
MALDIMESDIVTLPSTFHSQSSLLLPQDVDDELADMADLEDVGMDFELPPPVEETLGYDDDLDSVDSTQETESFLDMSNDDVQNSKALVPKPEVAVFMSGQQRIAELYSPPRVLPAARALGLVGCLSLDILTGWDFRDEGLRSLSIKLLTVLNVVFLILSPPCTIFSELQRLWNIKKMSKETFDKKWNEGMVYLNHSMECALVQIRSGRYFVFEHPWKASSWNTSIVQHVLAQPGVKTVDFDQCSLGLTSKIHKLPMRKRTKLMTNSETVVKFFTPCQCNRSHIHQTIQGSEGGVRRSVWAQCYPPPMVQLLAKSAQQP